MHSVRSIMYIYCVGTEHKGKFDGKANVGDLTEVSDLHDSPERDA